MEKNEFNLPKEALVNKFVAKTRFYEKTNLSSKIKKEFVDKVQKITWKYKLAESTIGITNTETVTEIQIFEIELKERIFPKNVLTVIDKNIPYQILYRLVHDGDVAYGITLKEGSEFGNFYFSEWNEPLLFDFSGINLENVYHKLVKAFLRDEAKNEDDFIAMVAKDIEIKTLEYEIAALESKMRKEKQFNRKIEIHKVLLKKKVILAEITGDLK